MALVLNLVCTLIYQGRAALGKSLSVDIQGLRSIRYHEAMEEEVPNLDIAKTYLERILDKRIHPKTMCPSEAARALSKGELETSHVTEWRELMQPLRRLVFEMRDSGEVEVLQKGLVLPSDQTVEETTGPIRLRRAR